MNDATDGFPLEPAAGMPTLPAAAPRASTSRVIAEALRTAIVDGTLAPGAPLRQDALARHFSVSAIPVREALRLLETEGWAKSEVHKGATVAPLSAAEAREIYEIRSALESLAIGLAIPLHTAETLAASRALCVAAHHEADPSRYVGRNEAFHMSLYAPAERPQLEELLRVLHRRGERYLRLKFDSPSYKGESDAEHVELMAAVERRDIARAQQLIAAHLLGTGDLLYRFITDRVQAEAARRATARGTRRTRKSPETADRVDPVDAPTSAASGEPRQTTRSPRTRRAGGLTRS